MITLSRHIESLLVRHNCVIVPKLGGFVAHYTPAYYNAKEGYFVPPYRNIAFNSMLAINDGLLIESYSLKENLCYTDAVRLIDAHVVLLKDTIAEKGEAELVGVGVLSSNGEGGYNFEPRKGGIMTPALYSLEYTPVNCICDEADETASEDKEDASGISSSKRNYIIRINRTAANYLTAAVMAIMFYFLLAPIGITCSENRNVASVVPEVCIGQTIDSKKAKPTAKKQAPAIETGAAHNNNTVCQGEAAAATSIAESPSAQESPVAAPTATPQEVKESSKAEKAATNPETKAMQVPATEEPQTQRAQEATGEYVIVLASAITVKHGTSYINKLKAKGYSSARFLEDKTMRRIIMGHFATEEEARAFKNKLNDNEEYASCWVMKI